MNLQYKCKIYELPEIEIGFVLLVLKEGNCVIMNITLVPRMLKLSYLILPKINFITVGFFIDPLFNLILWVY